MRCLAPLVSLSLFLLGACGDDSPASSEVDASRPSDATVGLDGAPEVSAACPIAGTWNLQNVLCGDKDITADWFRIIDRTSLLLASSGAGCAWTSSNETEACTEEERGTMVIEAGTRWAVVGQGITACTPPACSFGGQDAPCAIGDRAASHDAEIVVLGGQLRVTTENGICVTSGASASTTLVFEQR